MNCITRMMSIAIIVVAGTASAGAAEKIGVAACDDFLSKYEACVGTKMPAASQASFKTQLDQTRKMWADLAKDPATRSALEATCKQTAEQIRTALASYGCSL